MNILVNGDAVQLPEGSTVASLLTQLEIKTRYVAVEVNLDLVPRADHGRRVLKDGDELEVVTMVGGG